MSVKLLYHGTTERVAKVAPMSGVKPYALSHQPQERVYSNPAKGILHLTDVLAPLQALCAADILTEERWGIIEVDPSKLDLRPDPYCHSKKKTWQNTLAITGMCVCSWIPSEAIRKIWVFNPLSNWYITRQVLHTATGKRTAEVVKLAQWFGGGYVTAEDLLDDPSIFTRQEFEKLNSRLSDRTGLDLFYQG